MKIDTLAPSLFPDVLSHAGETYCALLEVGTGLVVLRWPDGYPERDVIIWIDAKATTHGFAGLTSFNIDDKPNVFVAYRRDDPAPEHVVAVNLTTGTVAPWSVPCWGMHPLCWGPGGMLVVTADLGSQKRVLVANWPDKPSESPLSRDATQAPTGISRMDSARVVFWHEEPNEPLFQNRVWTEDSKASVGVTFDDRVVVDILGTRGQVLSGHAYKAPRITREGNGAYTVCSHREGSQGPTGVEIVTGITATDLAMPEPIDPPVNVPPYSRAVPHFAYYTFDAGRGYGNHPNAVLHAAWCETDSDVLKANALGVPVITSLQRIGLATKRAFVMVANDYAGALLLEAQIAQAIPICVALQCGLIVYDERNERPANVPTWAVGAVKCFREPGESVAQWVAYSLRQIAAVPIAKVCPIFGVDDRLRKLTEAQIEESTRQIPAIIRDTARIAVAGFFSYARAGTMPDGTPTGGAILRPKVWTIVDASANASQPPDWSAFAAAESPVPAPEPEPPDPPEPPIEEIDMIALGEPIKVSALGDPVLQSDGTIAIKKKNGKWLSLNSFGKFEERDGIGGDEKFIKGKNGLIATGRANETFIVPAVEG